MSLTMYAASVPVFKQVLKNLDGLLRKADSHATAHHYNVENLLNARLFPNMFALTKQVQVVTDQIKAAAARLAGVEIPKYEDTETTIDELHARIAKTLAFLDTLKPEQINGTETKEIVLVIGDKMRFEFKGEQYLLTWVMPNVYFHVTTAYNILRSNGVDIGKGDFLGQ
jgi:hypothetical protein